MHVCDVKDLKPGDVFRVQNGRYDYNYGLTYGPAIYQRTQQRFKLFGRDYSYEFGKMSTTPLPVVVFDPEKEAKELAKGLNVKPNETTGSDPEIFVLSGKTKRLIPAFKFLPTQREEESKPHPIEGARGSGRYQKRNYCYRDGFAAEFYTEPNHCHAYLLDDIRGGLKRVEEAAKKFDPTANLTLKSSVRISKATMDAAKDEEVALGCSPSKNVYGDNPVLPVDARGFRLRFTGGHIHMSIAQKKYIPRMIKGADIMAALPGVAIFRNWDDPVRRQFYGRAGEYRTPSYGFEYRVLSNAWLGHPIVAHLFMNLVRCGAKIGMAEYDGKLGITEDEVRNIINEADVPKAKKWVLANSDLYTEMLTSDGVCSTQPEKNKEAFELIVREGVEALLPDYGNIRQNWEFDKPWMEHSQNSKLYWANAFSYLKKAA